MDTIIINLETERFIEAAKDALNSGKYESVQSLAWMMNLYLT